MSSPFDTTLQGILDRRSKERVGEMEAYRGATEAAGKAQESAIQSLAAPRAAVMEAASRPTPKLEIPDPPSFQPSQIPKEQAQGDMMLLLGIAMLGAATTRTPATAAMNAFSSGMMGMAKGDQYRFQKEMQTYQQHLREFSEKNRKLVEEYNSIIKDNQLNLQQKLTSLEVQAAGANDQVALQMAKAGNIKAIIELNDKREKTELDALSRMMHYETMLESARIRAGASGQAGSHLSDTQRKSMAAQRATGMPLSQVVPGFGTAAVSARMVVQEDAINQMIEERGLTPEEAGRELAAREIEYVAGKKSVGQLTQMVGATEQAIGQLDFNIKQATAAMDKLPSSDISPALNAIMRGEEKWSGNPAYSELFYYLNASAQESARIMSGGTASVAQLREGARKRAEEWANTSMTPKTWKEGVAPAMLAEGQQRLQTYRLAVESRRTAIMHEPGPPADEAQPKFLGFEPQ